jgi:hypothetical protein
MNNVYIDGNLTKVSAKQAIGKGGEADIFDIGNGTALKIFKAPNHPDLAGNLYEQTAAKARLDIHQTKLPAFPNLSNNRVIKPSSLAKDKTGRIVGYTMPFLKNMELLTMLSQRSFRDSGFPNSEVVQTFWDIRKTLLDIHNHKIVIGDFNDLNVMVDTKNTAAYFLDADSWQYGVYLCQMYTQRFVDPLLCKTDVAPLMLAKPHNEASDWYAYATMLFYSLLFVGPYGGIYKPKSGNMTHDERPLHRITVFNPEVKYPKPANHYKILTDELLQFFTEAFEKDKREVMPERLLQIHWTKCAACGLEHARNHCPNCTLATPVTIKKAMEIRGNVTSHTIFRTRGRIVYAAYQDILRYVYHEDGAFKREGSIPLINGADDAKFKWKISGNDTHVIHGTTALTINKTKPKVIVDTYQNTPLFDSNFKDRFWVEGGKLVKDSSFGNSPVGNVLQDQTLFWVGEKMGFGFYRAGNLSVAFVFNPDKPGINDSVKIKLSGQLVDSDCVFSDNRAWFFVTMNENGQLVNRCFVIKSNGEVEAEAGDNGDGFGWLANIHGNCAAGNFLLSATDDGILRVVPENGTLVVNSKFPDTEPFVNSGVQLFAGKQGLFVVDRNEIRQLVIK